MKRDGSAAAPRTAPVLSAAAAVDEATLDCVAPTVRQPSAARSAGGKRQPVPGSASECRRRRRCRQLVVIGRSFRRRSPTAEGQPTSTHLEMHEDDGADEQRDGRPDHRVDDVGGRVQFANDDVVEGDDVVEALELVSVDRRAPVLQQRFDSFLVVVARLVADAEGTLQTVA